MAHAEAAPTARDFMNTHVQTVGPKMSLADVVDFLLGHHLSNAPVVESQSGRKKLLGFVSEQDCLEALSNEMFYGNPSPLQTASTLMRKHPVCVSPDADLFALASVFVSHRFRHLPVVDDAQCLLGIVSRRDVLKALKEYYRKWGAEYDREHFPVDLHQLINHRFVMGR